MSSTTDPDGGEVSPARHDLLTALEQVREDARLYNEAVGSYNNHLQVHRDERDLQDLPFRVPVTSHDAYRDAVVGDRSAMEDLLADLLDRAHLDSELRRHPDVLPVHLEAAEHLRIARRQLVTTLEESLLHVDDRR